jgi:isopentenyl phosphate kinase
MDENEKVIPAITKENIAEVSKHLRSTPNDVTGGMAGKIKELLALDTTSYIVNASHQDRIEALFAGKKTVCTQINQNGR